MRALLEVTLGTEASNKLIADGSVGPVVEQIMGRLKPEAAYFFARDGRRAMLFVVDVPDEAAVVATCEPFWLQLDADVQLHICMNADDLREGLSRLSR
ncbi:hypothetical protein BX285_5701 [Streptomyces sp. 1114.5]|uniref:hypothetical protein n=1 Tax=unclassified Streptomyces TaxID=2593676 RepID=UPI000BD377F3|nr:MULTISPECIES: hypothetical protein [unclassified Streptomyces]RKT11746.1 hypothetical protein BX285_5701 [Streptomyces sp. 1114.5]SOB80599.1 hypothetical protein SAMN06272789_1028 [Streptomyces sp. 1331.2]